MEPAINIGLAICWLTFFVETFVLRMKFSAKNPPHRHVPKR